MMIKTQTKIKFQKPDLTLLKIENKFRAKRRKKKRINMDKNIGTIKLFKVLRI